ncbi:MAG: peptidoglycan DD-metalloendopeptidase family protein [Propionibacteriaceae bacterium]|nr:peptidoglycan DD-metalloendopeptidase family protein [Propionibacteriaceae bacterium]
MRRISLAAVLALALLWAAPGVAHSEPAETALAPLAGAVSRRFDPPEQPWGAGHRGVDLAGVEGEPVLAALSGRVHFAGQVAGRGLVSLDHGDRSTTYEPLVPLVQTGQAVSAGDIIGWLSPGHLGCAAQACLHWGLRQDQTYLDPLSLLPRRRVRLIPAAAAEDLRQRQATRQRLGRASLLPPLDGRVSSPFGLRLHPILKVWKLHDGLDLAASCGAPIAAAQAGQVIEVGFDPAYGNRLLIDHGLIEGRPMVTGYNHAQAFQVELGQSVAAGQVVGLVGSTGLSTGCHLHFQVWIDGRLSDPAESLP